MCADITAVQVERKLKLKSNHELLSYSMCTNVPGVNQEFFPCRQGDSDEDIKELVADYGKKLTAISQQSFVLFSAK